MALHKSFIEESINLIFQDAFNKLCNKISFNEDIKVTALIGVTIDFENIVLVDIKKNYNKKNEFYNECKISDLSNETIITNNNKIDNNWNIKKDVDSLENFTLLDKDDDVIYCLENPNYHDQSENYYNNIETLEQSNLYKEIKERKPMKFKYIIKNRKKLQNYKKFKHSKRLQQARKQEDNGFQLNETRLMALVKCDICGCSIQKKSFKRHYAIHKGLNYYCKLCGLALSRKDVLLRHMTTIHL